LIIAVVAAVIVAGGVTVWVWPSAKVQGSAVGAAAATTGSSSTATASSGPVTQCVYSPTRDQPAAKDVGLPESPEPAPASGTVRVTLKTDQGDVPMTLDRTKAPCTVQSMLFLAGRKYYDGAPCHRLAVGPSFKVLQCGDPSGTGQGGPGYQFADELPKGLTPVDADTVVYPKGTVAMANAGPGTNGSQFFLVFGDTNISPNYTVFGTYGAPGQTTIDKIAAAGVVPSSDSPTGSDGAPKTPVTIQQAVIGG
jgi:peptidyl-prolyl cis-trans isomerase B (cyclophilin B)